MLMLMVVPYPYADGVEEVLEWMDTKDILHLPQLKVAVKLLHTMLEELVSDMCIFLVLEEPMVQQEDHPDIASPLIVIEQYRCIL